MGRAGPPVIPWPGSPKPARTVGFLQTPEAAHAQFHDLTVPVIPEPSRIPPPETGKGFAVVAASRSTGIFDEKLVQQGEAP
jgi:hypothetical protein